MYYEINVTKFSTAQDRPVHWFATHERSVRDEKKAKELADAFRQMPGAHSVTVSRIETIGHGTSI